MTIIDTIMLVLIAGILSSTYAQSPTDVFMKALCTKNDKLKTYEEKKNHKPMLHTCLATVTNELRQILRNNYSELDIVLEAYCDKREDIYNCYKSSSETVGESCFLEPGKHTNTETSRETRLNVIASALRFPCENRMLTKEALDSPYMLKCGKYIRTVAVNCLSDTFLGRNTTVSNLLTAEIKPHKPDLDEMCSKIQKFQECSIKGMGITHNCIDDVFERILDSWFKYFNNDIPCANLPKTPKSDTSNVVKVPKLQAVYVRTWSNSEGLSSSVVNVLLLFYTVMAVTF